MGNPQKGGTEESKNTLLPVTESTNLPFEFNSRAININGYITGITGWNSQNKSISANVLTEGTGNSRSSLPEIREITHDLSNSLSVILSGVDLVKYSFEPEDEVYQNLQQIENSGLRARDLLRELQSLLKGNELIAQKSSIATEIEGIVADALKDTSIKCIYSLPDGLFKMEADGEQLKAVMENILDFSLHYMSVEGEIRVEAVNSNVEEKDSLPLPAGDYLKISIADRTEGISHERIRKIFESRRTAGLDVWEKKLINARKIISGSGGFMDVQMRKGGGTMFNMYFPAASQKEKVESAKTETIKEQGRVLVMDDMPEVRNIVSQILKRLGHEVDSARDGAETLRKYKQAMKLGSKYDVVILDLNIPGGMGGEDTLMELLKIDPGVNALVSSGCHSAEMVAKYEKFGFRGFVTKPFTVDELRRAISNTFLVAGYSGGVPYC